MMVMMLFQMALIWSVLFLFSTISFAIDFSHLEPRRLFVFPHCTIPAQCIRSTALNIPLSPSPSDCVWDLVSTNILLLLAYCSRNSRYTKQVQSSNRHLNSTFQRGRCHTIDCPKGCRRSGKQTFVRVNTRQTRCCHSRVLQSKRFSGSFDSDGFL